MEDFPSGQRGKDFDNKYTGAVQGLSRPVSKEECGHTTGASTIRLCHRLVGRNTTTC